MALGKTKTADVLALGATKSADVLARDRTDLAVERTVMAAGRTLMAWIRTALSLITFGFTIYKFLAAILAEKGPDVIMKVHPRRIGLTLIGLGTAAMILGAIEYFQTLKRLDKLSTKSYRALSFSFLLGMAIGLLGLFLFITILTHTDVF